MLSLPGWEIMNIYSIFANNLREESARHGTIADVCRGIGMNRQQFNKYLAGQSIPNASTLRKICDFLQIQEHELLTERKASSSVYNSNRSQRFLSSLENTVRVATPETGLSLIPEASGIGEGNYFCYFPLANSPNRLLRSLLRVTRVRGSFYFTRLTRIHLPKKGTVFRGKHVGIVMASAGSVYFMGRNRVSPYQASFMTFDSKNMLHGTYFFGLGVTRSTVDSIALRIVLQKIPQLLVRDAIAQIGLLSMDDDQLDPLVKAALADSASPSPFLSFASLDALITTAVYNTNAKSVSNVSSTEVPEELLY
jgi:transcriptional regulator with XRE-family HTH domain